MKNSKLNKFEQEILLSLAREESRRESGSSDSHSTVYSRVVYELASTRGKTFGSPVYKKLNVESSFRGEFIREMNRLIRNGLVKKKRMEGFKRDFKTYLGYDLHKKRDVDIFLTEKGKEVVSSLRAKSQGKKEITGIYDYTITIKYE